MQWHVLSCSGASRWVSRLTQPGTTSAGVKPCFALPSALQYKYACRCLFVTSQTLQIAKGSFINKYGLQGTEKYILQSSRCTGKFPAAYIRSKNDHSQMRGWRRTHMLSAEAGRQAMQTSVSLSALHKSSCGFFQ